MQEMVRTDILQDHFIVTVKGYAIPTEIGEEVQADFGNRFILTGFAMDDGVKDASLLLIPINGKKEIGKFLISCSCSPRADIGIARRL